ncbi:MAG: NAD(P)H-hydrate dehydratase, partial [Thermoguttaceae bacterium]|nr:NAD(P)H-hydrate dehydratase [Thermoguttaceae bacterium]
MSETYWPDAATRADFARRAEEAGRANPAFWGDLPALPKRPLDGHKGTFGTALVVGGSRGMSGAISLTGEAALVAGAGLTRLFVPEPILETVAGFAREYTTIPGACDAFGRLTSTASEAILREASVATALAVGPGFGRSAETTRLVVELFFELERPAVFDADALNALAETGVFDEARTLETLQTRELYKSDAASKRCGVGVVEERKDAKQSATSKRFAGRKPRGARILTPHPGEFARLTGAKPTGDRVARIDAATAFAKRLERLWGDGARRLNEPEKTIASALEKDATLGTLESFLSGANGATDGTAGERRDERRTQAEILSAFNASAGVARKERGGARTVVSTTFNGGSFDVCGDGSRRAAASAFNENASDGSAFVVALKGAGTVVADGSGAFSVNETGNPNLATGGSGDVLTGVVVGLLAQGATPLDATRSAVALCGLAADLRATLCSRGAVASDVIRFLPVAFDFYEAARATARAGV